MLQAVKFRPNFYLYQPGKLHRIKALMHERGVNLVVLCQPLPSARCSRFDLTCWKADRQVCNERIFSFPTSMRDHHSPVFILSQLHYLNGLGHCTYLIHLSSTKAHNQNLPKRVVESHSQGGSLHYQLYLLLPLAHNVGPYMEFKFSKGMWDWMQ